MINPEDYYEIFWNSTLQEWGAQKMENYEIPFGMFTILMSDRDLDNLKKKLTDHIELVMSDPLYQRMANSEEYIKNQKTIAKAYGMYPPSKLSKKDVEKKEIVFLKEKVKQLKKRIKELENEA